MMGQRTPEMNAISDRVIEASSWAYINRDVAGDDFQNLASAWQTAGNARPGSQAYSDSMNQVHDSLNNIEQSKAQAEPEVDPGFGNVACDCAPGEPCCLKKYKIEDKSKPNRKVEWPINDESPDTLFLTCKEPFNTRPSAEATIKLIEKNPCQSGVENRPFVSPSNFANAEDAITDSETLKVTTPFQVPALPVAIFPEEIIAAYYMVSILFNAETYRSRELPSANPCQCIGETNPGLKICPLPHMKLTGSVTGSVGIGIYLSDFPQIFHSLEGDITAEFGNQVFTNMQSSERRVTTGQGGGDSAKGIIGYVDRIISAVRSLCDNGSNALPSSASNIESALKQFDDQTGCELKFSVGVRVEGLELRGKDSSPDLELIVPSAIFECGPEIKGTIDLIELFLSRFPRGQEIRSALANDDSAVEAEASCKITLSGKGTGSMTLDNGSTVVIGNNANWEAELGNSGMVLAATCEFKGEISAHAKLKLEIWVFSASASAEASISTGWKFGVRENEGQVENLYYFEGIVLKARATMEDGSKVEDDVQDYGDGMTAQNTQSDRASSSSDYFSIPLMQPEGSSDGWE